MKISLIQLKGKNINDFEDTIKHILELTEKTCQAGTDLILLPECSFPGYFIGLCTNNWEKSVLDFKTSISKLAQKYNTYIATGLADEENGRLFNRLIVYNRDGKVAVSCDKSNLWHFDSNWFEAGETFPVFDSEFGRIGCMVCADGRIPEIARCLTLQGARLILDSVNLVASAATPAQLSNQQYSYILRQRARENGVFIAVSDKCGIEDASVTMLGRSMVIDPNGNIFAECGPEKEEVLTCEINLSDSDMYRKKAIETRTPEFYQILSLPTHELPALTQISNTYSINELECYTGLIRFDFRSAEEYASKAAHYLTLCQKANCRLAILPYAAQLDISPFISQLCSLTSDNFSAILGHSEKKAVLLTCNGSKSFDERPDQRILEIFPNILAGVAFEHEPSIPENIRIQMLQGADLCVWFDNEKTPFSHSLMQTRAAENKIFMLRSTTAIADFSLACNPDGAVLATTFSCKEQVVFAPIYTALSKCKTVVPGTNIITSRHPSAYRALSE